MIFPDKVDYITFSLSQSTPVNFTFSSRKPKKIFLDCGRDNFSFRISINDNTTYFLLHMSLTSKVNLNIPSKVDKLSFTTNTTDVTNVTLFIEEWGN